jgi:hypothetical protein
MQPRPPCRLGTTSLQGFPEDASGDRAWPIHGEDPRVDPPLSKARFREAQVRGRFCVGDMSHTRAAREGAGQKSSCEKGISAGHVRDTASGASDTSV